MGANILGTTGDVTICDCCGRVDLKMTVVIEIDGEIGHYGTQCASHKLRFSALEIKRKSKKADNEKVLAARRAEAERLARVKQHPLYLEGVRQRDELTKEFGFWSRAPKSDPRINWYILMRNANEAVL